jgi:hypothetical protein
MVLTGIYLKSNNKLTRRLMASQQIDSGVVVFLQVYICNKTRGHSTVRRVGSLLFIFLGASQSLAIGTAKIDGKLDKGDTGQVPASSNFSDSRSHFIPSCQTLDTPTARSG